MRARFALILGTAALVAGTAVPSGAAPAKVLDGKKVKKLTMTASGGLQNEGDLSQADLDPPARTYCAPPRCARLDFVFKPAKGTKGNLVFRITWTNPASDMDLFIATDKKAEVASCGGTVGTGEMLSIPMSKFKAGKKYTLIADFYRSVNDTVTATVEFPNSAVNSTTVPSAPDPIATDFGTNCSLDGSE